MSLRNFSSTAIQTTLVGGITASGTSAQVAATTGFPAAPFILCLESGTANQELTLVTNVAGTTLTITRGYDSTTGVAHNSGATVTHSHGAIDFREANAHVNASSAVHGLAGAMVGTTDAQALTNKDLSSGTNTFPSALATDAEVTSAVATHAALTATHGATGAVVGTTNTQTLTGKTVDLASNTLTGTKAQFNTACSDADFATIAGTETLTGKTLTSPTVTGLTLDGVNVSGAWASYSPTWTAVTTNPTLGNGTISAAYMQIGKTVHFRVKVTFGTTTTLGSGAYGLTPPVTAAGAVDVDGWVVVRTSGGARTVGICYQQSTTETRGIMVTTDTVLSDATRAWANGDSFSFAGTYEAA